MNHKNKCLLLSSFIFSSLALGVIPTVNAADAITAEMTVLKIEANKKATLKATDAVKPNVVLEYGVEYKNVSTQTLKAVRLNLPIPTHVTYTGHALPNNVYASTDGVKFAKAPLTRIENGKQVAVPLKEYRALQWEIKEFKPKQKVNVSAQVRVNAAE